MPKGRAAPVITLRENNVSIHRLGGVPKSCAMKANRQN